MEAYIGGISTRKVDALVAALGIQSSALERSATAVAGVRSATVT
ncbi:hypothetical protein BBFGKLBO_00509 [Synechococcus sp. CBW1107]|jgi:transposase-like protein|nr:hypothetical protein BBFGKLBO_00509 [Synechococcus sp. CBW1107]